MGGYFCPATLNGAGVYRYVQGEDATFKQNFGPDENIPGVLCKHSGSRCFMQQICSMWRELPGIGSYWYDRKQLWLCWLPVLCECVGTNSAPN